MLNFDAKDKALKELKQAIERHESIREQVKQISIYLFEQRQKVASEVIKAAETYVNILANSPKEFDQAVSAFRYQVNCFRNTIQELERKSNVSTNVAAGGAAGGVAAGVGVAAFAPTAAMAIATTFGTASTGTAIASLSGAAATNAALAWLGGGAIAAGGGGMAAGNAVLAMAGPVGWTIGGVTLVGSGVFMNINNAKIAEEATEKKYEILSEIYSLTRVSEEIKQLSQKTKKLADACLATITYLRGKAPQNYTQFSQEQKELLGQLINCIRSLGELLNTQTVL
ncbi:MAG: hypothetical protein HC799_19350 [Limnothrix sp. RL_2_0]|nr:hypothetical protein [Limnothrix sp. RL_2_0]